MSQTFEHAGITISLLGNGSFSAEVQGKRIIKASLVAMKKHIDTAANDSFVPISVLDHQGWKKYGAEVPGTNMIRCRAVGIGTNGCRGYRARTEFLLGGGATERRAYRDCPEAIAVFKKIKKLADKRKKIEEELEAEDAALRTEAEAFVLNPDDCKGTK